MRQWGLLTPWFPAGTGALASSETGVEDAKAGALPASVLSRRDGSDSTCSVREDGTLSGLFVERVLVATAGALTVAVL